jgi:homoserine dehydrogenase
VAMTRYHINLDVADKPGVLAAVAGVFAKHEVSIATVRQSGRDSDAKLVIVTHGAPDANLAATVESLSQLEIVRSIASVLRVEGGV